MVTSQTFINKSVLWLVVCFMKLSKNLCLATLLKLHPGYNLHSSVIHLCQVQSHTVHSWEWSVFQMVSVPNGNAWCSRQVSIWEHKAFPNGTLSVPIENSVYLFIYTLPKFVTVIDTKPVSHSRTHWVKFDMFHSENSLKSAYKSNLHKVLYEHPE